MKNLFIYKYLVIGITTVGIDYGIIYLIYTILNMNYILAIVLGFLVSNLFQFYANFFYTFSLIKNDDYYRRMILFSISTCIGIFIGTFSIIFLEQYIKSLYISKTISLFISFAYGYTASKYVVFNKNLKLKI